MTNGVDGMISFNMNETFVPCMESRSESTMRFLDYQNVLKISEDTYLLTTRYYIVDTDTTEYILGININYIKQ